MDSVVENDTLPTHWKLGQNDSIELLEFIFPDGALLLKQKGALAPSADQTMQPEHYTMDQILKYMRASGFYGVPPDSTSSSRSKRKGKGKGKEKYEEEWIGGSDCPALAAEASTKREGSLARFFNNVLRKAKAACDTINYRSWTATTSEEPLKGGDAIRKPDITSFFTNDLSCWQTVATFCEVKNRDGPQSEKSSYIEIGGKASHLLYTQDSRHSAISIRMLGRCMYLTIFDRGGSISTCPVDIHKNPLEFLRILIGVSSCSFATLGFDQSMEWRTAQRNGKDVAYKLLTIKQGGISRTIRLVKVLFISDNIHGRGTTVWEGLMKIPNSDTRIAEKVVVKDSWIDPLRKYTEGMILHMLENAGVQGVPKMIHEQQVEMAHPKSHAAKINSSTHIIRSKLEARHIQSNYYYLRVLSRIISQPVGQLVTEVSCLGELFVALLDYTVAHKEALEKAGVLHRDVSLLNLLLAAIASSHGARSDYAEYMNHLSQGDMSKLTNRIKKLQRRGILADWGYAVPVVSTPETAEPPAPVTTSGLTPDHVPTSPILPPTQTEEEVPIDTVLVKIPNEPNLPVPISDLTENDNIVLAMGIDDLDSEDPRQTLDSNPLFRTGTWSWMAAELSMVGPGQPVSHTAQHDLESLFYVLLGLCVLLEKPLQVKSEKDLAACFDKFFNTSQPSVLKTITIQSDLTWHPHFVQHISEYFQPVVPLLDKLRKAIILPLAMDSSGRTLRKRDFSHQTVIQAIIQELYNLPDYAWTPYKTDSNGAIVQVKDDDGDPVAESESDSGEMDSEGPASDRETTDDVEGKLSDEDDGLEGKVPDSDSDNSFDDGLLGASALPPSWPPITSRDPPLRPPAGPGFASIDSARRARNSDDADFIPPNAKRAKHDSSASTSGLPRAKTRVPMRKTRSTTAGRRRN